MNSESIPSHDLLLKFAEEIDCYVRQRFQYSRKCATPTCSRTIDINKTKIRLYLRFHPRGFWPADSLVIASIGFGKPRAGHGRALLEKLVEWADRYGYCKIGIEQTCSEAGVAFAQKYGFQPYKDELNWIMPVDDLLRNLAKIPTRRRRSSRQPVSCVTPTRTPTMTVSD